MYKPLHIIVGIQTTVLYGIAAKMKEASQRLMDREMPYSDTILVIETSTYTIIIIQSKLN